MSKLSYALTTSLLLAVIWPFKVQAQGPVEVAVLARPGPVDDTIENSDAFVWRLLTEFTVGLLREIYVMLTLRRYPRNSLLGATELKKAMVDKVLLVTVALCFKVLTPGEAHSQTTTNLAILKGLAPLTVLLKSTDGRAALAANFAVTGGLQTGLIRQPTLLPFAEQQLQALKDAFITDGNLVQLADGLGTTLGAAYLARAHYGDRDRFANISQPVADLIAYTDATTREDFELRQILLRQRDD